ncbi:MAG TPA: hypothetical protein VMW69_12480, partial [Spirochaetia bacterium]|nr:hypothetical protein [Spirochaetia bacterium]
MNRRVSAGFFLRKFTASLLPVIIPLAILGTVSIYITSNSVNREILTATTRQLDALKETLDLSVFDLDTLNLAFSSNTTITSALDGLLGKSSLDLKDVDMARLVGDILSDQINARPYVVSVYVYLDHYPQRFFATDL